MYSQKVCICSICRRTHQKDQCYLDTITNDILCLVCLTKVKKERNAMKYKRTLHQPERRYDKKRKYNKKYERYKAK